MDKIKPSEPCDTHPFSDPEILKVIQSLLPQKGMTLEQEVRLLIKRYSEKKVRDALAKVTTGARKNPADKDIFVWLAVERYRFHTPGGTIKSASEELAKKIGALAGKIKKSELRNEIWTVPGKPGTIRRIHSKINKQVREDANLRAALEFQLACACGQKDISSAPYFGRGMPSKLSENPPGY